MNDTQSKTAGSEVQFALLPVEPTVAMEDACRPLMHAYCSRCEADVDIKCGLQVDVWRQMVETAQATLSHPATPHAGPVAWLYKADGFAPVWSEGQLPLDAMFGNPKEIALYDHPTTQAGALQAVERYCNKCGYFGPDEMHQRPNGSGQCDYLSCLAAAQPNAAPAAEVVARYHFTDGTCTLKQDVLDAINVYAGSRPEEDAEEPESWESWFEAAFDLCSARVHDIFDEHARREASNKQEVNHG